MAALAVCRDRGGQQHLRLLSCLLLASCILEGTRTDAALQLQFPTKTPSSRWVLGFSVIRIQFANAFSVDSPISPTSPQVASWCALLVLQETNWTTGPSLSPPTATPCAWRAGRPTASPSSPATSTSSTPDIYGY